MLSEILSALDWIDKCLSDWGTLEMKFCGVGTVLILSRQIRAEARSGWRRGELPVKVEC